MEQFTRTRRFRLGNARRSRYEAVRDDFIRESMSTPTISPDLKGGVWQVIKGAAADGGPQQTMAKEPAPIMISYQ